MMWIHEPYGTTVPTPNGDVSHVFNSTESIEYIPPKRTDVTLEKDELSNVIEFIELNFIESIRTDPDIDNIDYIISMMSALQKFRIAYADIDIEGERKEFTQEESV